jgi:hypothetical protein
MEAKLGGGRAILRQSDACRKQDTEDENGRNHVLHGKSSFVKKKLRSARKS